MEIEAKLMFVQLSCATSKLFDFTILIFFTQIKK